MISHDDIRQLQRYPSGNTSSILSLYLNIDQSDAANLNRGFETKVDGLFRQIAENHNGEGIKQGFETECSRVRQFLRDYVPKGKALVVFSDSSQDFWWQRDLQVELPTEARWSPKPWLRPLLEVIEEHERFGVVLIDKHRGRLLTVDAAGMENQAEILSDVPGKHATTGTDHIWSQSQMDREHTNRFQAHAKRVADELGLIIEREKLQRIVVGGPVEATSAFIAALPKRYQQMIIGTISAPVDAPDDRLIEEVRAVQESSDHEDESKAVESLITSAMKGERAVIGLTDTLGAIHEGRVYRLLIARDFHVNGRECGACRVLFANGTENCVFCGEKAEEAPDLVNRASHRVLEMGGKVQLVSGEAAAKLAEAGIGAVLRF